MYYELKQYNKTPYDNHLFYMYLPNALSSSNRIWYWNALDKNK